MPNRRQVLTALGGVGLGAALAAPVVIAPPGAASAAPEVEPECLADLIESGAVTRADLVAR